MSTMTKVFVVLTAVLSIAVSCLFISAAAQWDNWRKLAQTYQTLQAAEQTARMNAEATAAASLAMKNDELAAKSRALENAQGDIQRLTNRIAELEADLARARNDALAFEAGRTKLQEILDVTTGELKALQRQNQALLTQNLDLQTRNARMNDRILELTTNVTILTDETRNIQEKLYACEQQTASLQQRLGAGGVRPVAAVTEVAGAVAAVPAVAGPVRGEIVAIDGNYVSINVGETSGVVAGMTFMVWREGVGYLADVTVDTVRPGESGGKLSALLKGEVRVGDPVVYGLEQ